MWPERAPEEEAMKPVGALLLLFVVLGSGGGADEPAAPPKPFPTKDVPKDMKPYFIVFLVAGPKYQPGDPPERKALLPKHLAHIRKLIEAKKLRFAGPTMDEGRVMGVGVVAAQNIEQAKAWMDEDPAVQAGFFANEVHPVMFPSLDRLKVRF